MATIPELARLYGRSERTVLRWKSEGQPIHDPEAMAEIISDKKSRRGVSKFAPKQPVVATKPAEEPKPQRDELLDALHAAEAALIRSHFAVVALRFHLKEANPELYEKLSEVLEITRPFVEEPEA
jgi:hypothetical protein